MVVLDYFGNVMAQSGAPVDTITGSAGSEDLVGTATDDQLVGGGAGHRMFGGLGDDTYVVNSMADQVFEDPGSGIDTVSISGTKGVGAIKGYYLPDNVENLYLQATITGIGNDLPNIITGDAGTQVLIGGGGNDALTGGGGADTFVFSPGSGYDVITDFSDADGASIRLQDYGFKTFADVQAAMTQDGPDTILRLSPTDAVRIDNMAVGDFQPRDFVLPIDTSNLQLTFDDEFNSLSLYDPKTGLGTWTPNFAFGQVTGPQSKVSHTHGELEIYVDPSYGGSGAHPLGLNPFSIDNGVLDVTAALTPAADKSLLFNYKYTSGLLTSEHSFYQQYGYFEMRAELPQGQGVWPAFWLLPKNASDFGIELDAMENIGANVVYATIHDATGGVKTKTNTGTFVQDTSAWHTYGLLWTAKEVSWYVDGTAVYTLPTPADMNQPMYLLTNLAIGGRFPGSPPADFTSAQMHIDYIRAYSVDPNATALTINDGPGAPPTLNIVTGTAGDDTLVGSSGDDLIQGLAGDDTLRGELGQNTLDGGPGFDTASYSDAGAGVKVSLALQGRPQVTGGAGVDSLVSIENLTGSAFADTLKGDDGPNVINGGFGFDTIDGGAGDDTLNGGAGQDTVVYTSAHAGVTVSLAINGPQNTIGDGVDTLSNFENLKGGNFNDSLTGDDGPNSIAGGKGDDMLFGGLGDDTLAGGAGNDTLDGGPGIDTATYANSPAGVTVSLAITGPQNTVALGIDTLANIENLIGTSHNDTLTGDDGPNQLVGGKGDDLLVGLSGDDLLNGGVGDDTLVGGPGVDRLIGGPGSDVFVFQSASDSPVGTPDVIADFKRTDNDHIDLSAIDAATTQAGDQAFSFIGTAAFSDHPGELRYTVDSTGAHVFGDVNGDGVPDFEILVAKANNLLATDFVL